ncbi:MAG: DUF4261 domain-containing protein [Archangium sp.]
MPKKPTPRLAYVLLPKHALPTEAAIRKALKEFPELETTEFGISDDEQSVTFTIGETDAMAVLLPMPVPNGEADAHTDHSLSGVDGSWTLPEHRAHFVVAEGGEKGSLENLVVFTRFVAVLTRACNGVGVYWGEANATHHPEFVIDMAKSELPLPVWVGLSFAGTRSGFEILSLGMKQLGLPDLLLKSPTVGGDEFSFFYDLLAYVARLGKKLPDGDSVGRNAKEKLKVKYVKSPIDPKVDVWSVTLPASK